MDRVSYIFVDPESLKCQKSRPSISNYREIIRMARNQQEISLFPKQSQLYYEIIRGQATVIGFAGGRGSSKSSGLDRCILTLMSEHAPLLVCVVMRNWDQVYRYHVEPIKRDFPWVESAKECDLKTSPPARLMVGSSQLDFSYAENLADIERRFRSANYDLVIIDQAEQFSGTEIREIRKAARSAKMYGNGKNKGWKKSKVVLSFNMRGAGISDLRDWFHLHKLNKDESPDDYAFIKINPWDNVVWVAEALEEDGYSVDEYYRWTDEQRKRYAAERGAYTKQLATDDEVIRKADWEGDWNSIEGTYFQSTYDQDSVRINPSQAMAMMRPWARHWLGQDWGQNHYTANYWFYRIAMPPSDMRSLFGWELPEPVNVTCIYREYLINDTTADKLAQNIIGLTPLPERDKVKSFFLSPEECGDGPYTVASLMSKEMHKAGMPGPIGADNDRVGGWQLMAKMFRAAKFACKDPDTGKHIPEVLFISSECPTLLEAIPKLVRDPKNLDDVLKTDKTSAKVEMDIADAVRYGLKSMLAPRKANSEEVFQEKMAVASPTERAMIAFKHLQDKQKRAGKTNAPSWKDQGWRGWGSR